MFVAGDFFVAFALSVVGGLVLNVMPCVLPVLSLKVLSLSQATDSRTRAGAASRYALGVALAMLALWGLVMVLQRVVPGGSVGWGFWMQQPAVVGVLALVMLGIALSMIGVWQAPVIAPKALIDAGSQASPLADYANGILAVAVAAPCTAPAMGTAMAYAFGAPPLATLAIFMGLALGLALPVLAAGFVPGGHRVLPKPGAWMAKAKVLLALPMFASAAWLMWVVFGQTGMGGLLLLIAASVMVLIAMAQRARLVSMPMLAGALVLAITGPGLVRSASSAPPKAYAQATLKEQIASQVGQGRRVMVNVTADWCVTCLANEKRLFSTAAFKNLMTAQNVAFVIADYSDPSPELTAFLKSHRAVGVPLYVVFGPTEPEGVVLTQVPTLRMVKDALAYVRR